ncbi:MAG: hypothetical protein IJC94_04400 [Oscillospiraceae bacterium]|nr:hypothetical protein [Oscillospiraceae bacterium]MBQ9938672.1 hypothetical protein [Oscillospiraceae bacterium]
MAKKYKLTCDKTEINAVYEVKRGGDLARVSMPYDKVISITFENCVVPKFLKKGDTERIVIRLRGYEKPIEFYKDREGDNFEGYKADFEKFAKANRITFYNNL